MIRIVESRRLVLLGAAGLLFAGALAACSERPSRAFAQETRLDERGNLREDAFLRVPLSAVDERYVRIDGARMKELLLEVTDISLQNRDDDTRYWGRIAGTRGEEMAREWVEAKFHALGLEDIRTQHFDLPPQWFPVAWDVNFVAGGQTYRFPSLLPALRSGSTPPGGLDLELVWVGLGTEADFIGRDVTGKAVLMQTIPAPGSMGHSASSSWYDSFTRARENGAAAVIAIYGITDNFGLWQGITGGVAGAWIGYHDGLVLKDLLGRGEEVRVRMDINVEMREGLQTASIWGTLPGATDEEIYVLAHLDGYFEAALDNASGMSVMITLAEFFSEMPREDRRRNIVFIGTAGHHVGSPGARWMAENRETAMARTALMINAEHVSVVQTIYWTEAHSNLVRSQVALRGVDPDEYLTWGPELRKSDVVAPRRWWVNGSDALLDITLDAFRTFGVGVWDRMEMRSAGEMSPIAPYVPSVQVIRSPEIKHTDHDTPEWVPQAGLEAVARAFAKIIDEANRLDRAQLFGSVPVLAAER